MTPPRTNFPIIAGLVALIICFSQLSLLLHHSRYSSIMEEDGGVSVDSNAEDVNFTRGNPVTVFSEGFESGDFNAGPWIGGNGWSVSNTNPRTGTYRGNAQAHVADSTLTLTKNIDLTNYVDTEISLYQHTIETENDDFYHLDVSGDGGATWSAVADWNGQGLRTGAYGEYKLDLSAYNDNSLVRIRFRFTSSSNAEYWLLDDIKITAIPVVKIDPAEINISPLETYRYNGSINISGRFSDIPIYELFEYKVTIETRDRKSNTQLILDNKTSGNVSLTVVKRSPGNFSFSYNWSPSSDFIFGRYDILLKVYNVHGWEGVLNYVDLDANFTLLSVSPSFIDEVISFEKEPVNLLDHRGIGVNIVFYDLDSQPPDDFTLSFYLNGTNHNFTLFESLSNASGLNITLGPNGRYDVVYTCFPEDIGAVSEGKYACNIILREESGHEIDLNMFNISRNVTIVKRNVPVILSLSSSPRLVNITGLENVVIQGTFSDLDTFSLRDFEIYLKIRDRLDEVMVLADGIRNGEDGLVVEKKGDILQITYRFDPPASLLTGEYDLYIGIFDGDSSLNFDGFENNTDEFFLYNNTSPSIDEITLSKSLVNIYGNDSSRLSIIFSDMDGESMGNFTVNLTLRDQEGNIFTLVDGENEGLNASMPYLAPVDGQSYVFTYDIDPGVTFSEGLYLLSFSVWDHWGGNDALAYGENDLNLTFFYNYIPSPPSKIWPNSTSDTLPLISWWGALDQETPYMELEYSIRIGTTGVDDNVLPWTSVGQSTTYQVIEELGVGVYNIQVKSYDGDFYSDVSSSVMTITSGGNRAPGVPGAISPLYTVRQNPLISWGASTDQDVNDLIEYFITIGTDWHGSDIIKSTPTSINIMYQLPFTLPYGTYYVQVMATDGHEFSPIREQLMIIFDPSDNIAPFPPKSLTPSETRNPSPLIRWEGAVDLNDDDLLFWFQMGSGPGQGDLIPWRSTGEDNFFQIDQPLAPGDYNVQLKCYDGKAFSGVFESVLRVKAVRKIIGPTEFMPRNSTDTTPLINWTGAHYLENTGNNENFSYYIRIGSEPSLGDILQWTLVSNVSSYQVEAPLRRGELVYVEIKAFDGHQYSEVSSFSLRIGDFVLTVGFNETNYIYTITEDSNRSIRAFIKNSGRDDVTVELGLGGSFSKYVKVPAGSYLIKSGEMVSFLLLVDIPPSANVNRDSVVYLIATSTDDAFAQSELLGFTREEVEDETWGESLGMDLNLILGSLVLLLALFILLILIIKRRKRGKKEQFEVIEVRKRSEAVEIDDLIPTSIYSTHRLSERRTFEAIDKTLLDLFKVHGIRTKPRVKGHKGKALTDGKALTEGKALAEGKGGKKTPALPPPAPGGSKPEETKMMPPPPGERVEFLPPGEDVTESELPPAPEMEYIPPEGTGKTAMDVSELIVDAEEIPVDIPESDEISDVPDESEADAGTIPLADIEGDAEPLEVAAESPEVTAEPPEGAAESQVVTAEAPEGIAEEFEGLSPADVEDDAETPEELSEGDETVQDTDEDSEPGEPVTAEPVETVETSEPEASHLEEEDAHPTNAENYVEPPMEEAEPSRSEPLEPEELSTGPESLPAEVENDVSSDDMDAPASPVSVDEGVGPGTVEKTDETISTADDDSSALDDIMDILGIDEE